MLASYQQKHVLLAHSLIVRRASRNTETFGTSRSISSVTREPPRLRTQRSSKFLSRLSSRKSRSGGIDGRAKRAKSKSISIPLNCILMMGTYASGTLCTTESGDETQNVLMLTANSVTSSRWRSISSKISKKSCLSTIRGTTQSVSISAPDVHI